MRILINLYYLQSSNVLLISRQSFVVFCPACVRGQQVQLSHVLGHHPETKVLSIDGNSIIHNDYKKCYWGSNVFVFEKDSSRNIVKILNKYDDSLKENEIRRRIDELIISFMKWKYRYLKWKKGYSNIIIREVKYQKYIKKNNKLGGVL